MKLSQTTASLLLGDDGRAILEAIGFAVEPLSWMDVEVAESEDIGLWIRVERDGMPALLLIRWEYILAVSLIDRQRGAIFGLLTT